MSTFEEVRTLAESLNFDVIEPLDVSTVKCREDIRSMCNAEQCLEDYGKNWSCPPHGPSLEEIKETISSFNNGVILQIIGKLNSQFDYKSTEAASQKMSDLLVEFSDLLQEHGINNFTIGPGACTRCHPCTFPDEPCPYPEDKIISMSACGIFVSQLCNANNVKYYYDPLSIAFIGCAFFN